jgi:beta-galactosidase
VKRHAKPKGLLRDPVGDESVGQIAKAAIIALVVAKLRSCQKLGGLGVKSPNLNSNYPLQEVHMAELNPSVWLGSQYYVNTDDTPEQIRTGIEAMARAGLKLVRIFLQWTHVEPRQGHWDWSQYDALFEAAAAGQIGVIITLTALHPPGWMKITFGPQDLGPLDDPAYWERAKDYIRQVVTRYGHHPAMHSWILNNEPQLFLSPDPAVLKRFQKFVEQKYGGDIALLNRRSFQQLDTFAEVSLAGTEGGFSGYTGRLNWLDFMGYRLQEILTELQGCLRATGDLHPVHVNPHGLVNDMYPQGQSIWAEGRLVDFMGCSAHPSWHSTRFLPDRLHQSVALFADLMRGATRAPNRYFWVTELQGGTNIFSGLTYLGPSEDDLRSWVWESIGAGAKAVVFWCFNYRVQGYEAGEWSLVDQLGRPSRRLVEISKIAAFLEQHQAIFAASRPSRAPVALLFSEATWKLGNVEGRGQAPEDPRNCLMGADALTGAWMACVDAGLSVDILDETDLQHGLAQGYSVLIAPGCTALEEASLSALQTYVEGGGVLLADGLCGYKDPWGWLRDPAHNPVNALFGASVADIQAVPALNTAVTLGAVRLPVWFLKVVLEPQEGVQVLATFAEPAPRPALTAAARGKGQALRLGTSFFQHYFRDPAPEAFSELLRWLPRPIEPVQLLNPSAHLRLRRLDLPDGALLLLLNAGGEATARLRLAPGVSLLRLTATGEEPVDTVSEVLEVAMASQSLAIWHLRWEAR